MAVTEPRIDHRLEALGSLRWATEVYQSVRTAEVDPHERMKLAFAEAQVHATLAVAKAMEPPETEGPSPVEIIAGWLAHLDADELDRAVLEHLDGAPPMEVALRVLIGWASGAS